MANDYDIAKAEALLMQARNALGKGVVRAADRLHLFAEVTDKLGRSVIEIRRLQSGRAEAIHEALDELRGLLREEIELAVTKHTSMTAAFTELRKTMFFRPDPNGGKHGLWDRQDDKLHEFSRAFDKLVKAHMDQG